MKQNWKNINYLQQGNVRQRSAFVAIRELGVMKDLPEFTPVLVGTVPLDIDVETSDLDIICYSTDLTLFAVRVRELYQNFPSFREKITVKRGLDSYIAQFSFQSWKFEVFAQAVPVEKQSGFRHLVIEDELLEFGGTAAKKEIRKLKKKGMKTEPAFTHYFKIDGEDPYEALLRCRVEDNKIRTDMASHM